jgi:hypothetical protein
MKIKATDCDVPFASSIVPTAQWAKTDPWFLGTKATKLVH